MCFNAILPLVQAEINPNQCGFELDNSIFQKIRNYIEEKSFSERTIFHHLLPLQRNISDKIEYDLFGSKEFFKWFKDYDLKSSIKNVWSYRDFYNWLPFTIAKILDKIYQIIGVDIHDHSPITCADDRQDNLPH